MATLLSRPNNEKNRWPFNGGFTVLSNEAVPPTVINLDLLQLEIEFLGWVRVRNTADLHIGSIPSSSDFK